MLTDLISTISTALKLPTKILISATFIFTSILLFIKDDYLKKIFILDFRNLNKETISLLWLISVCFIIIYLSLFVFNFLKNKLKFMKENQKYYTILKDLTPKQRKVIFNIFKKDNSGILKLSDATTQYLSDARIIVRPQISVGGDRFSYYLSHWVLNYLKKHKNYFKGID